MSAVVFLTATPRDRLAQPRTVRLAGGGAYVPYRFEGEQYLAGLIDRPRFRAELGFGEDGWTGGTVPTTGTVSWMPAVEGRLADLAALYWPGAAVRLDVGPEEGPLARLLTGTVANAGVADGVLVLTIADLSAAVDVPLVTAFAGTGGLEGPAEAAGKPKRRSWGRVFNVEARPFLPAFEIHEVGDPARALQAIPVVRDKGRAGPVEVLADAGGFQATLDALKARVPPRGGAVVAPSIACVRWWTSPAGPLTADLVGEVGTTSAVVPIAEALLAAVAGPPIADVVAARALRPASAGLHLGRAEETAAQALDRLLLGVSLLWVLDPAGQVRIREWTFASAAPVLQARFIERQRAIPATAKRRVGYQANNRMHSAAELSAALFLEDAAVSPNFQLTTPAQVAAIAASSERIAQIASDSVITAGTETDQLAREWRLIDAEWRSSNALALAQAAAGAETPAGAQARATAAAKLNSAAGDGSGLNDYLDGLTNPRGQWRDITTDKPVMGATLRQRFADAIEAVKALTQAVGAASGRTAIVDPTFGRILQPDGTTVEVGNQVLRTGGLPGLDPAASAALTAAIDATDKAASDGWIAGDERQALALAWKRINDTWLTLNGAYQASLAAGTATAALSSAASAAGFALYDPANLPASLNGYLDGLTVPTGQWRDRVQPYAVDRAILRARFQLVEVRLADLAQALGRVDGMTAAVDPFFGKLRQPDGSTVAVANEAVKLDGAVLIGAGGGYLTFGPNLLVNPNFDANADGYALVGAPGNLPTVSTATSGSVRRFIRLTQQATSLQHSSYTPTGPYRMPIRAGETAVCRFTWRGDGPANNSTARLNLQIQYRDALGNLLANGGGAPQQIKVAGEWATTQVSEVAPAGTASAGVRLNGVGTGYASLDIAEGLYFSTVDPGATKGATAGRDLLFGDGTAATDALIRTDLGMAAAFKNQAAIATDATAHTRLAASTQRLVEVTSDSLISAGAEKRDLVAAWSLRDKDWSAANTRYQAIFAAGYDTPALAAAAATAAKAIYDPNNLVNSLNGYLNAVQPAWNNAAVDTTVDGAKLSNLFQQCDLATGQLWRALSLADGTTAAVDPFFGKIRQPTGELIEVSNQVLRTGGLPGLDASAQTALTSATASAPNLVFDGGLTMRANGWALGEWLFSPGAGSGPALLLANSGTKTAFSPVFPLQAGTQAVAQCEFAAPGITAGVLAMDVEFLNSSGGTLGYSPRAVSTNEQDFVRRWVGFTAPTGTIAARTRVFTEGATNTGAFVRRVKVAIGTAPTVFSDEESLRVGQRLSADGRGDGRLLAPNLTYSVRSLVRQPTPSYVVNGSGFDVTLTGGFLDAPWGTSYALPTITIPNQPAATKLYYVRNIASPESAGESGFLTADAGLINSTTRVSVMSLTTPASGQTTGGTTGSGTGGGSTVTGGTGGTGGPGGYQIP